MQTYTLHTHSIGFDGQNTVSEMVSRAKEMGFETIGISNHFIVKPGIKKSRMYKYAVQGGYSNMYAETFDEAVQRFIGHYAEIDRVRQANPDINILRGMEVDFFNNFEWRYLFDKTIKLLQPDYLIGSGHFVEYKGMILNSHDWKAADFETQDIILKTYWKNIAVAAKTGLFDWMAHLDLPKKVGLGREEKWKEFENRALESIAQSKTAIEINTSFYKSDCYEPYPSNRILKMVAEKNVPVLISDDAHNVDKIGRHFVEAEQLIQQFKLRKCNR